MRQSADAFGLKEAGDLPSLDPGYCLVRHAGVGESAKRNECLRRFESQLTTRARTAAKGHRGLGMVNPQFFLPLPRLYLSATSHGAQCRHGPRVCPCSPPPHAARMVAAGAGLWLRAGADWGGFGRSDLIRAGIQTRSGGVASAFSSAIASASGRTRWRSSPKVRMATVPSSASRLPTTRRCGTFCSECSRTL